MVTTPDIAHDELVKRIRRGDLQAFEQLVRTYQDALYRFLWHFLRSEELAKDVLQDLFVTLWQRRKNWQVEVSLSAYLYRSAKNAALNALRRQNTNRRHVVPLDGKHERIPARKRESDPALRQAIERCIDALPAGCRTAFCLSRFEQFKYREIAATLDISVKTVENHLARALKLLRKCLQPFLKEDEKM